MAVITESSLDLENEFHYIYKALEFRILFLLDSVQSVGFPCFLLGRRPHMLYRDSCVAEGKPGFVPQIINHYALTRG